MNVLAQRTGGTASNIAEKTPEFRRLHPLSILLRFGRFLRQNIILIGALYFGVLDQNLLYTGLLGGGILFLAIAVSILIWSRFTYQVTARGIQIKSGLLRRNSRSIPFDRIQDVSLEQKLIARILGLATVKLETGASAGEDGKLDALAFDDARAFRDTIRDYKSGNSATVEKNGAEEESGTDSQLLFAMDNKRILIAGLFNFSFILLAILGAIAQNLDFLLPNEYFDPWYWARKVTGQNVINRFSLWAQIGGIVGALLTLIFIGMMSGIIRTFFREYGFRLERVKNGFRRRRGLFTLTDMVMPVSRVQAAIISTGPVRKYFGWHHLKFQSLASDGSGESDHSAAPCAKMDDISPIMTEAGIANVTEEQNFQSVSSAMWWRNSALAGLLFAGVSIGIGFFIHPAFYALILLWLPVSMLFLLNWRRHRFASSGTQLFVYSGWWRCKLAILPLNKIQSVDIEQSPLDHSLNLASLIIGVAGGSAMSPLKVNDIPSSEALALRRCLLQNTVVETDLTLPAGYSR